jgi:hypothetical protein
MKQNKKNKLEQKKKRNGRENQDGREFSIKKIFEKIFFFKNSKWRIK